MLNDPTRNAQSANEAVATNGGEYAICLKNVKFGWSKDETLILDIPFFALRRGERLFIFGASGSGKSTLLSLIAGVLLPLSGAIEVDGAALNALSGSKRDRFRGDRIGYIFQQFNLISYLSVIDNVLIPCRLSPLRSQRAKQRFGGIQEAAKTLLERLDLAPSLWGKEVSRLSVGQQQRVAAARALIGSPPVLIADEPTSSLDANRREDFLDLLLQACAQSGCALLFVSHDHALRAAFDRVARLESGTLTIDNDGANSSSITQECL
ncbi:MAG: ABC transporter ATP-binding protein [Helicobacteraceae bacterium]|nr:ABC transporter ATP-binding protein [Helicobacteraceae bacterium]